MEASSCSHVQANVDGAAATGADEDGPRGVSRRLKDLRTLRSEPLAAASVTHSIGKGISPCWLDGAGCRLGS